MPIMNAHPVGILEFGRWKAFHASSTVSLREAYYIKVRGVLTPELGRLEFHPFLLLFHSMEPIHEDHYLEYLVFAFEEV